MQKVKGDLTTTIEKPLSSFNVSDETFEMR